MDYTCNDIKCTLAETFSPDFLEVMDDSARHADHHDWLDIKGPTHIIIRIKAAALEGHPIVQQHRMIYQALTSYMDMGLHAVQISTD